MQAETTKVPGAETQVALRAIADVVAARLARLVRLSPYASRWAIAGFELPAPGVRAYVLTETEAAARGLYGQPYELCVEHLLLTSAAREAQTTGEDPVAVHKRLEATWARYQARRS